MTLEEIIKQDQDKAPELRVAVGPHRCGGCVFFAYVAGRSWRGDGECVQHEVPVHEDFVCAAFIPLEADSLTPDGDSSL